jgi:hypothetical protein
VVDGQGEGEAGRGGQGGGGGRKVRGVMDGRVVDE